MRAVVANLWQETTLGETFQTVTGNTPPKSQKEFYGDAIPLVKPPELTNGNVSYASDGLTELGSKFARLAPEGSTLVSCIGNLGKIGLVTKEVAFNQQINAIFPNAEIALPRFIYFVALSPQFQEQLTSLSSGTTVPIVNKSRFNSIRLALPRVDEQKRIVAVLDQAFAALDRARAHAEANLSDSKELLDSELNRLFATSHPNWQSRSLDDVCSKIGSGATPRGGAESYKSEGISLIRSLNVHDREFRVKKLAFIDDEQADKLSNVVVQASDVLFNITGASVARCCVVPSDVLPARVNQHVAILRTKSDVLRPEFLCLLLTSTEQKKALLQVGMEGGSTRQAITKLELENLLVSFPESVATQDEIVANVHSLELRCIDLMNGFNKKREDIANLRQSLLQKAFSGQLT